MCSAWQHKKLLRRRSKQVMCLGIDVRMGIATSSVYCSTWDHWRLIKGKPQSWNRRSFHSVSNFLRWGKKGFSALISLNVWRVEMKLTKREGITSSAREKLLHMLFTWLFSWSTSCFVFEGRRSKYFNLCSSGLCECFWGASNLKVFSWSREEFAVVLVR